MAALATAKARVQRYADRRKLLEDELREVKTKQRFWEDEVAKHVRLAERANLPSETRRRPGEGKVKGVKATILKGSAKTPGNPGGVAAFCTAYRPDICNTCRRRLAGLRGGKAHTCGKILYAR